MIRLINCRSPPGSRPMSPGSPRSPMSANYGATVRMQKDLSELDLPLQVQLTFPNGPERCETFEVAMTPDEGCYAGGTFVFRFRVPDGYPSEAPKVHCLTQVFHPAIDNAGHVDMSLLRDEWRPDMTVKTIILGLWRLFLMPESDDSLNSAAGGMMHADRSGFERAVEASVHTGATIEGKFYAAATGERNVHSRCED